MFVITAALPHASDMWLRCFLSESVQPSDQPRRERPASRYLAIIRSNLTFQSVTFRHAIRLGAASALATIFAEVLHLPRDYWVVVTVLVVLKPNFGGTIERVIQRIGGTIVGGVIAMLISIFVRDETMLFLCVARLAFISFSIRGFGYGFFTLVLTPLFMVLLDLVNPGDWEVSLFRILDTLVGGMLALIGGYTLFPVWEREQLPLQLARTLLSVKAYFDNVIGTYLGKNIATSEIERAKRHAALEVANATTSSQRLLSEPSHLRGEIEPTLSAVNYERNFYRRLARSRSTFTNSAATANRRKSRRLPRLFRINWTTWRRSCGLGQLKRLASHLRILQNSVARLKGLLPEEGEPREDFGIIKRQSTQS